MISNHHIYSYDNFVNDFKMLFHVLNMNVCSRLNLMDNLSSKRDNFV